MVCLRRKLRQEHAHHHAVVSPVGLLLLLQVITLVEVLPVEHVCSRGLHKIWLVTDTCIHTIKRFQCCEVNATFA